MSEASSSEDELRKVYVVSSGQEYDDWGVVAAFSKEDSAKNYIKKRCADFSEFTEWDDGGGIIWNSEESYVDGYRIDVTELDPEVDNGE